MSIPDRALGHNILPAPIVEFLRHLVEDLYDIASNIRARADNYIDNRADKNDDTDVQRNEAECLESYISRADAFLLAHDTAPKAEG